MKKIISVVLVSALMVGIFGCETEPKNARLQVWLTDAPGDYKEVNVEIVGVEVHADGGDQQSGWKDLNIQHGIYDLLKLTNGLDTLLGTMELPAGPVSQLRLVLGNDNTVVIGEETYHLNTPSGQQSGLKIQIHKSLAEGITYKVLLDFDVARSVVTTGNASYSLKPVIRSIIEAESGAIKGSVTPIESTPAIYAISGTDTVATTYTDDEGRFLLRGVPAGSYTVAFAPNSNYQAVSKDDVTVTLGSVTDLGSVSLAK